MNTKELKELKEKIENVNTYYTESAFNEIKDLIEDYSNDYEYLYDDILTEVDVLDKINGLCSLDDIKYYIDDVDTSCYLWRDGYQLENIYKEELDNIKADILEKLQKDIETTEKEEVKTKFIETIKQFQQDFIARTTGTENFSEELVNCLLDTFNITLKEEN